MKTVLFDLLDVVNENIGFIENSYPAIRDILEQIDTLLKKNPSNEEILEWMLSNQNAIETINKCIRSIKK